MQVHPKNNHQSVLGDAVVGGFLTPANNKKGDHVGCWTGIVIHQVYYSLELVEYTLCDDYYRWFGIEMIEEYRKIAEARTTLF